MKTLHVKITEIKVGTAIWLPVLTSRFNQDHLVTPTPGPPAPPTTALTYFILQQQCSPGRNIFHQIFCRLLKHYLSVFTQAIPRSLSRSARINPRTRNNAALITLEFPSRSGAKRIAGEFPERKRKRTSRLHRNLDLNRRNCRGCAASRKFLFREGDRNFSCEKIVRIPPNVPDILANFP